MSPNYRFKRFKDLVDFVSSDLRKNLSLKEIEDLLSQVIVQSSEFAHHVIADPEHYHRERLVQTDFASLYVLTWLPGQESPIHDHRSSNCGVRVLKGEMAEYFYKPIPGTGDRARRTAFNRWQPGVVTSSEQGIGIHKVANETQDATLVTLHLYSPPLLKMTFYTEVDNSMAGPLLLAGSIPPVGNRRTAL
jgi:predicted metal-dependent enzyme (double-stranded beta helix superfamily)